MVSFVPRGIEASYMTNKKDCERRNLELKEITVFSCGDSRDISTWSNVPYLFTKTLEERGIKVNRVDISPSKILSRLFNTPSFVLCKRILHLRVCPEFSRTIIHRFMVNHKIKKATEQYPDSEFNLFLTFAFLNPYSNKPNVLWCDWTESIRISRIGRKPMWYERQYLRHECDVMRRADLIYTMFPECKRQMETMYGREILYLNRNVVNTVYDKSFSIKDAINQRKQSNILLFIGNFLYKGAALELVHAFENLQKLNPQLECHIVGMPPEQLFDGELPHGVICHGYLRKDVREECDMYYSLLLNAKVLVNHSSKWGGFSSIVEGMFYGCPVVVAPYDDFVACFSEKILFGCYCDSRRDNLEEILNRLLNSKLYDEMCVAAHDAVQEWTWNNYVDAFCESLQSNL